MSFGYGASDFIGFLAFAKRVYDSYRDAPIEFQFIATDVEILHTVIEDFHQLHQQLQQSGQLDTSVHTRIQLMVKGCEEVLKELENFLNSYKSLDPASVDGPRKWDRIKFFQENMDSLRQKVVVRVTLVLMLNSTMLQNKPTPINENPGKAGALIPHGLHRHPSIASINSIQSCATTESCKTAWQTVIQQFRCLNISPTIVNSKIDAILQILQDNRDRETTPESPCSVDVPSGTGGSSGTSTPRYLAVPSSSSSSTEVQLQDHPAPDIRLKIMEGMAVLGWGYTRLNREMISPKLSNSRVVRSQIKLEKILSIVEKPGFWFPIDPRILSLWSLIPQTSLTILQLSSTFFLYRTQTIKNIDFVGKTISEKLASCERYPFIYQAVGGKDNTNFAKDLRGLYRAIGVYTEQAIKRLAIKDLTRPDTKEPNSSDATAGTRTSQLSRRMKYVIQESKSPFNDAMKPFLDGILDQERLVQGHVDRSTDEKRQLFKHSSFD